MKKVLSIFACAHLFTNLSAMTSGYALDHDFLSDLHLENVTSPIDAALTFFSEILAVAAQTSHALAFDDQARRLFQRHKVVLLDAVKHRTLKDKNSLLNVSDMLAQIAEFLKKNAARKGRDITSNARCELSYLELCAASQDAATLASSLSVDGELAKDDNDNFLRNNNNLPVSPRKSFFSNVPPARIIVPTTILLAAGVFYWYVTKEDSNKKK